MANERLDRFTKLLKEIFELDKSDLDFGIYRVMNLRKTQIEEFLTQRLPQMVQETLAPFAQGSKEEIRAQMTQIEESVAGMGMTVEALPDTAPMKQKYMTLQKSLAEGADLSALETDECKERNIDLCETFNYLIGLTVNNQSAVSYFLSKPAENPAYEGAVDLVSDISGQYAFRQIEGTLPDGRRALVIWRTVTDDVIASNAALDAYFTTYRKNAQDRKYDVIFVNGDSNLENLRGNNESWKVQVTEIEFKKRMFEEV